MFQTLSQVIRTTKVKSTKLKIVQLRRGRCPLKRGTTGNREKTSPPLPHQIRSRIMLIQFHVWLILLVLCHNNLFCRNNSLGPRPFVSVGVTCAGTSPTSKENARLLSGADQVGDNKTKSRAQPEASEFVKDEYLLEQYEFKNQNYCSVKVKGRLRTHLKFWKNMCAYDNILEIIKNVYKIPFYSVPQRCFQKNNNSALLHSEFVEMAILELLEDGLIEECVDIPFIVNPLTVSVQSNGKKRLILDLRCVNLHILKQSVKYKDIRTALVYVKTDSFMFSFDLHACVPSCRNVLSSRRVLGFFMGCEW